MYSLIKRSDLASNIYPLIIFLQEYVLANGDLMVYADPQSDYIVQYDCLVQFDGGIMQHYATYTLNRSLAQGSYITCCGNSSHCYIHSTLSIIIVANTKAK